MDSGYLILSVLRKGVTIQVMVEIDKSHRGVDLLLGFSNQFNGVGLGIMSELYLGTLKLGRRGFLRACALLGLGGAITGLPGVVARQPADESEFVVINGWVLPARYFQEVQA